MNYLKKIWRTLQISLILTFIFLLIFQQFTIEGVIMTFIVSCMYSFILGFGQGIINDFLSSKFDWVTQTNKRVWLGIICTTLYTIPAVLIVNYILFVEIQGIDEHLFFKNQYFWIHLFYILISFFVSSFLHARSFMLEWKKSVQKESKQHQIVAETESAKFETLKNQIDPHFLFNSLNVLTSLIVENPNQAEKFTTKLSKVYRYVLEHRNKTLIPIEEELYFAKTYIDLLQMRFEDAIQFELPKKINSELKIVPLSLQLLLENAVKHNVVSASNPLKIKIYEKNGFLTIENNINLKQILDKKSTKIGLQNIASRYKLISSKEIKINNNNEVFSIQLPLLKQVKIMETSVNKNLENQAKEYVYKLKAFYSHLIMYFLCCSFFLFLNLKYSPNNYWFIFPIAGWGIGIISHALKTFNVAFFGKKWEERKVKEYIDKNR